MNDTFLWVEKYRPKKVEDIILPSELKKTFSKFLQQKNVPNLLLVGKAGTGKTTTAKALLEEIGADYILINGSMNGNIDTLRNDILGFVTTLSFKEGRKYVILDEADYLNPNSTQPALRNFMESYSDNAGFILTCNYPDRIIRELHSRCSVVEFKIPPAERPALAIEYYNRVAHILNQEQVQFDKKTVIELIKKFFPDLRRILNELQRYSSSGKIDSGIFANLIESSLNKLFPLLKDKNFTAIRKWVAEVEIIEPTVYRALYDASEGRFTSSSIPELVLILNKYDYQNAFVADAQINFLACLTEIMVKCQLKD